MTLEITTNRAIAAQILRHRSFTYQEFSQRYADTNLLSQHIPIPELRRQDEKNRQNSTDDLDGYLKLVLESEIQEHFAKAQQLYNRLLNQGVAKECARFVLPLAVPTKIYMSGSVRSWIHYIDLRSAHGTQKEHMDIANACKQIFVEQFPVCAEALEWI
jgi:thymidylate synthase (FAD)